jgi:HlyD family secretion protein
MLKDWSSEVDTLSTSSNLDTTISSTKDNLEVVRSFLDKMALLINNPNNKPSNISQTTWDTWRGSIAASRTSINATLSNLSAAQENITAKESAILTAKANLDTAHQELAQKEAPTRSTDIAVYQAQIEQAVAAMKKVQTERDDLLLVAPIKGLVTETNGEVGEIIAPSVSAVSILADGNLQIKLNVVEDNIVNVKVGQTAKITLDALPDKNLFGTVTAIDPAETTISGAVYYQTTVVFNTTEDFIRSGMTANVWIRTAVSTSTLFVPVSALQRKGNRKLVDVLEGNTLIEKEVATGLKNNVGMIEITYGLSEGEKVVLGTIK